MRNELRVFVLLFVGLAGGVAQGQTTPSPAAPAVPILQQAALPMYPPIAKVAHVTGKVIVRATVKDGLVVGMAVLSKLDPSGQRFLETPTLENLKTWRFAADVTGEFTVTYIYEISGEATDDPTNAKVEMLPSLDVRITARPLKPTCMDCGAPPMKVIPRQPGSAGLSHVPLPRPVAGKVLASHREACCRCATLSLRNIHTRYDGNEQVKDKEFDFGSNGSSAPGQPFA